MRYKPNLGNFDTTGLVNQSNIQKNTNANNDEDDQVEELEDYQEDSEDENQQSSHNKEDDEPGLYKAVKSNPVVMVDRQSKNSKQRQRDLKRLNRNRLIKELKDGLNEVPEEVNYGIASGNKRVIQMNKEDEELEMQYFKRINYSAKERKQRLKKMKQIEADDINNLDGTKDYQLIDHLINKKYDSDDSDYKRREKQKFIDEHRKRDKKTRIKLMDEMNDEISSDNAGYDKTFQYMPKRQKRGKKANKSKKNYL